MKATQIAKELDNALCKGNWQAIPVLARKYKKHNPSSQVMAQTALAEAKLSEACKVIKDSDEIFKFDSPENMSATPRLKDTVVRPIQQELRATIQLGGTLEADKEPAKVVLARTFYEIGNFAEALSLLSHLTFQNWMTGSGYSAILLLQAKVMKAVALHMTDHLTEALVGYKDILSLLHEMPDAPSHVFVGWAEEGLYYASLTALREDIDLATSFMRMYHKITETQVLTWRPHKRLNIIRCTVKHLSQRYQAHIRNYPSDPSLLAKKEITFTTEATQLYVQYENLVYYLSQFPHAGHENHLALEYADQLSKDMNMIAASPSDLRAFVEAMYRITQRTFNSPSVARHLFIGLVKLGEYDEAQYAARSYLHLVGLITQSSQMTRNDELALVVDKKGNNIPVPQTDPSGRDALASHCNSNHESAKDILYLLMQYIRVLCKDLNDGVQAVEMAEIARRVWRDDGQPSDMGAQVLCSIGTAYSLLATQTIDPACRSVYHDKSLEALKKSISMDDSVWQSWYQLALQQAEMRDINQAVQSITKALQLNPNVIEAWHLLALACSCPIQGKMAQALKSCDMGLQIQIQDRSEEDDFGSWSGYDNAEQHLLLEMTQALLLDRQQGPESSLHMQQTLFGSFGLISAPEAVDVEVTGTRSPVSVVVSGSLNNLTDAQNGDLARHGQSPSSTSPVSEKSNVRISTVASASDPAVSKNSLDPAMKSSHHRLHLFRSHRKSKLNAGYPSHGSKHFPFSFSYSSNLQGHASSPMLASEPSLKAPSLSSTRSLFQKSEPILGGQQMTRFRLRQQRSARILCNLWLLSATSFLRLNRIDEALKAVEEAENIEWVDNAALWCMLGRCRMAEGNTSKAIASFQKGLFCDCNDVDCTIWLAKTLIETDSIEMAEVILDNSTRGCGWNNPEAWYHLGNIYQKTDRVERAKACLLYALDLEQARPIQPFSILPRCV